MTSSRKAPPGTRLARTGPAPSLPRTRRRRSRRSSGPGRSALTPSPRTAATATRARRPGTRRGLRAPATGSARTAAHSRYSSCGRCGSSPARMSGPGCGSTAPCSMSTGAVIAAKARGYTPLSCRRTMSSHDSCAPRASHHTASSSVTTGSQESTASMASPTARSSPSGSTAPLPRCRGSEGRSQRFRRLRRRPWPVARQTRPPAPVLPDRAPAGAGRSTANNHFEVRVIRAPLSKRRRRVGPPADVFAD